MDIHKIFGEFRNVMEKYQEELNHIQFYPEMYFKPIIESIVKEDNIVGYSSSPIKMVLPKSFIPSHTVPKELNNLEVVLEIKNEIKINIINDGAIKDPVNQLIEFNLIFKSDEYTNSWHLDRHTRGDNDGKNKYSHPIYHWTFGGRHMENEYLNHKDFGKTIIMRNPRLMHPPMDLILGLDFIFTHFIQSGELELLEDTVYKKIISQHKEYFWRPYALAFAKNFCSNISVGKNTLSFDETFVKAIFDS